MPYQWIILYFSLKSVLAVQTLSQNRTRLAVLCFSLRAWCWATCVQLNVSCCITEGGMGPSCVIRGGCGVFSQTGHWDMHVLQVHPQWTASILGSPRSCHRGLVTTDGPLPFAFLSVCSLVNG